MDRWPSFSRSGSRKLLRFHQCLKEWRQFTPARSQHGLPEPGWEGIARRLTLLNHAHMETFVLIAGDVHASFRNSGVDKEGSCPTACAASPIRDRSFRNCERVVDRHGAMFLFFAGAHWV